VNTGDTAWVLISAALVLFMTVGLAFFYGGLEPHRNVLHMVAMNMFTIAIVTLTWVTLGFTLAFGPDAGHGLIGNLHYAGLANMSGLWPGTHIPKLDFMAFQMMFAIITPALITGALAGRHPRERSGNVVLARIAHPAPGVGAVSAYGIGTPVLQVRTRFSCTLAPVLSLTVAVTETTEPVLQ